MPTTRALIHEALQWEGRPYRASGSHESGANCLGIWGGILRNLGGLEDIVDEIEHYASYAKQRSRGDLLRNLVQSPHLEVIRPAKFIVGNLIITRFQGDPRHLALVTEPRVILHASQLHKRVIRQGLPSEWKVSCEFRIKRLT